MLPSAYTGPGTGNNRTYEIPGVGYAVAPKTDCPHFDHLDHFDMPSDRNALKQLLGGLKNAPCKHCQDTSENWFCLKCHDVACSRYKNGHMADHNAETNHCLALSLADLSLYCYECDAYVENREKTRSIMRELHFVKFGEYPSGHDGSISAEEAMDKMKVIKDEQHDQELESRERAFEILAEQIRNADDESIVVLTGAGLSTSAGIPDFRTPGTGLYDNLQKYDLPRPTAIFELSYFFENPKPFFTLSRDFISTGYKPTKAHYFIKLLEEKNKLLRLYTQNIDGLEAKTGISTNLLVNCHGMYDTAHCTKCNKEYTLAEVVKKMGTAEEVEIPHCDKCNKYVKPDIVLFGESLPDKFSTCVKKDLGRGVKKCKVFIVIGTSLSVYPVAGLPEMAPVGSTRALFNREKCGPFRTLPTNVQEIDDGHENLDLFLGGEDLSIDDGVDKLVELLGWQEELDALVKQGPVDLIAKSSK